LIQLFTAQPEAPALVLADKRLEQHAASAIPLIRKAESLKPRGLWKVNEVS